MALDQNQIYQAVTDRFIEALKEGVAPWQKPWVGDSHAPRSIHGRPYRGINALLLAFSGYRDPRWATFNQVRKLKGSVREGEKSTLVVLWKLFKIEEDGEEKTAAMLKYFRVFNVEQCDFPNGNISVWEEPELPGDFDPLAEAESVWENWLDAPPLETCGTRAFYTPALDTVTMPARETFKSAEGFYSTLWHEGAHATGHPSRLDRFSVDKFIDGGYAREELVAEMTAAFICAHVGIEGTFNNSASYLKSWLRSFEDDPKMIIWAAGRAQKAADYIMQIKHETDNGEEAKEEAVA